MSMGPLSNWELTPRERLRSAWWTIGKRRGLIVKVTLLILGAIFLSTLFSTPMYRAESSLYIRLEQEPPSTMAASESGRSSRVGAVSPLAVLNSYVEALLSRTTAEQVVGDLALDEIAPSGALRDRVKRGAKRLVSAVFGAVTRKMAGGIERAGEDRFRRTVDELRSSVAAEIDQDTELILLTVLHPDRQLAQKINERMIDILAERSLAMGRADAAAAHAAVLGALPAAAQRVGDADRALADFKQRSGIITFSDEQRVRTERLNSLEAQHDQARATLEETEARLSAVRRSLENRSEPITLSTVLAENPTVRQIKADLYEKEESLAGLLQSYTEDHPDVIRLRKQISAGQDRLRREVERVASSETQGLPPEYSTLVESLVRLESDQMGVGARERATAALLKKFRAGLRTLAEKEQELVALVREQQVAADLYTGLKQRAEELRNASLSTMPPVSMVVVDPPRLPKGIKDIGTPKYVIIAILAPILALLIGLTSAFVAEYFDDTIGTEEEVTHRLGLPVLTSIPYDERPSGELLWEEGPSVIGRDDG